MIRLLIADARSIEEAAAGAQYVKRAGPPSGH
jgi:hypothetical protein